MIIHNIVLIIYIIIIKIKDNYWKTIKVIIKNNTNLEIMSNIKKYPLTSNNHHTNLVFQ